MYLISMIAKLKESGTQPTWNHWASKKAPCTKYQESGITESYTYPYPWISMDIHRHPWTGVCMNMMNDDDDEE